MDSLSSLAPIRSLSIGKSQDDASRELLDQQEEKGDRSQLVDLIASSGWCSLSVSLSLSHSHKHKTKHVTIFFLFYSPRELIPTGHGRSGFLSLLQRTVRPFVVTPLALPDCTAVWSLHSNERGVKGREKGGKGRKRKRRGEEEGRGDAKRGRGEKKGEEEGGSYFGEEEMKEGEVMEEEEGGKEKKDENKEEEKEEEKKEEEKKEEEKKEEEKKEEEKKEEEKKEEEKKEEEKKEEEKKEEKKEGEEEKKEEEKTEEEKKEKEEEEKKDDVKMHQFLVISKKSSTMVLKTGKNKQALTLHLRAQPPTCNHLTNHLLSISRGRAGRNF